MHFVFLTRCYTPYKLDAVKESIKLVFSNTEHTYLHCIIVDVKNSECNPSAYVKFDDKNTRIIFKSNKPENDKYNITGLNEVIKELGKDGYVYVLDDDNTLHPDFLQVADYITGNEDCVVFKCVNYALEWGNKNVLSGTSVGKIDWACYITKLSTMKKLEIPTEKSISADGLFFERLRNNNCNIKLTGKTFAYYNHLGVQKK